MEIIKGEIVVRYVHELNDEDLWEIQTPIIVVLDNGFLVTIEYPFLTDFASVPKVFWSIISSIGKFNLASVVHDYLYTTHILENNGFNSKESRKYSDNQFLKLMDIGCPKNKIRNRIMYFFVRLFGNKRYKQYGNAN